MKYIVILLILFTISCSRTRQSPNSENYKNKCNKECQTDYGTDVDFVGSISGDCYCK